MSKLTLDVPALTQELNNCCWHTCAMMIWQYWQQKSGNVGPMNTMGPVYTQDTGLSAGAFITLGKTAGLKAVPLRYTWYASNLKGILRARGPIWCAGYWKGGPHVIVLTGIDGNTVYFNDPQDGLKKTGTVHWFNTNLNNGVKGCMMHKDQAA